MEAIPAPVQTALGLFETTFADMRFGDIDAKTLSRAAAEVHAVATVVASAQAALDSARIALEERQEVLLEQVQRAIAYARVYAENDEALRSQIDAITLPRLARRSRAKGTSVGESPMVSALPADATPRKRGRPARVSRSEQTTMAGMPTEGSMTPEDEEIGATAASA